jgi:hypothetical protein
MIWSPPGNTVVWLALIALAMMGCTNANQGIDMTSAATTEMRTICLGRLLVDMPGDFEQTLGGDVELIYGLNKDFRRTKVQLVDATGGATQFNSTVSKQLAELRSVEHSRSSSKNMLAATRNVNSDTVLIRAYDEPGMLDYFKLTVIARKASAVVRFVSSINKGDNAESVEAKLLEVATRTSSSSSTSPGSAKGTCFGPLLIDAGQDGESFTVAFKTPRMPDVSISFDINSLVATSDGGLFKRLDKKSGLLAQGGIGPNSYRRRKVMMGERAAEEVFRTGKERDHVVRQFIAEVVMDKPATFAVPMIAITLSMGGQVGPEDYRDASMSEADATVMWNAILKSIRLRPGAV